LNKIILWFGLLVLLISLYFVVFRTQSVIYYGEDKEWSVKINAQLEGLNGSYTIKIQHKGKESINVIDYNIYPHYQGGVVFLNKDGYYLEKCKDDCGYYDQDEELLFFIVWREDNFPKEKREFLKLRKTLP
jgi:hypothetical protein